MATVRTGDRLAIASLIGLMSLGAAAPAIAQPIESSDSVSEETVPYLRPPASCPSEIEPLMAGLLRDLPGYANRVAHRSLGLNEEVAGFGTILVAGRAEFDPLDISTLTFSEGTAASPETIQQVFFTTLERQYTATQFVQLEQYHWLFLTAAEDGWRLALMFSRVAADETLARPPTPPRETSEGIIGQAVRLWLRDCRAGAIYPVEPAEEATVEESTTGR